MKQLIDETRALKETLIEVKEVMTSYKALVEGQIQTSLSLEKEKSAFFVTWAKADMKFKASLLELKQKEIELMQEKNTAEVDAGIGKEKK